MKELTSTMPTNRPPIVVVLGHVDHGKTTLLDTIRKTNVASKEHGGITQHIGAYQIKLKTSTFAKASVDRQKEKLKIEEDQLITFIDTPGHEAFAQMRSRGAQVADIAILVVAADDSVKPQTKESIQQIHASGIPVVVAINKIDLPTANIDKVKQDLAKNSIQVEGYGGDIPFIPISAKSGVGIDILLQKIFEVATKLPLKNDFKAPFEGIIIETRIDKGKGMVATLLVKKGVLHYAMPLFLHGQEICKVRALFDEYGESTHEALPGKPVEVLGFLKLPPVGSLISEKPMNQAMQQEKIQSTQTSSGDFALPDFLKPLAEQQKKKLSIILKADTAGSIEAITSSLSDGIDVIMSGVGEITEADVLQAKSSKAIIISFQSIIRPVVAKLASVERVVVRNYTIIYKLLEELTEVAEDLMHNRQLMERELGRGQIIAEFPFEGERIAGTRVNAGRLARGDSVKLMRGAEEIARVKIKSMRRAKNEVTKTEVGIECGILLDKKVDFQINDDIIAVTMG